MSLINRLNKLEGWSGLSSRLSLEEESRLNELLDMRENNQNYNENECLNLCAKLLWGD